MAWRRAICNLHKYYPANFENFPRPALGFACQLSIAFWTPTNYTHRFKDQRSLLPGGDVNVNEDVVAVRHFQVARAQHDLAYRVRRRAQDDYCNCDGYCNQGYGKWLIIIFFQISSVFAWFSMPFQICDYYYCNRLGHLSIFSSHIAILNASCSQSIWCLCVGFDAFFSYFWYSYSFLLITFRPNLFAFIFPFVSLRDMKSRRYRCFGVRAPK